MIWLIPFLLVCLFLLFRFVSPFESVKDIPSDLISMMPTTKEAFQALQALLVSPAFQNAYGAFLAFHQEFQTRWREALDMTASLSQEGGGEAGGKGEAKGARTDEQRNVTVQQLTASQGKPFPLLVTLPSKVETLEDLERGQLLERIPPSAQAYLDALEWMNQALLQAQKQLQNALQGGGIPKLEGFEGTQCAEIAHCFKENPDLVRQVVAAQQEEAKDRLERIQRELMRRFEQFQQPRLRSAFELNGRLRAEAKEVQRKAQTGEWVKDIRIGGAEAGAGKEKRSGADMPGANALEELRRSDPERYAEAKKSPLFSVKQLIDQINRRV